MSWVTSVILTMSSGEEGWDTEDGEPTAKLDAIDAVLAASYRPGLRTLSPLMSAGKRPQSFTFGGAYNYFPTEEFMAALEKTAWAFPENVVLIIQPDQGETLVWRPKY